MKACVIGASTPVGRIVAGTLAEMRDMEVVAVHPEGPLEDALADARVAIGCVAPDRKAEQKAARAAVNAKVPYLSGADSPETFQALTELEEEASGANCLVVAGLSWSPGLTNLMAVYAAAGLDEVREVRIAWTGSCLGPLGSPLLSRAIRAFSGDAVVYESNGWRLEAAGKHSEKIFFPEPAGWRTVATSAAAEPFSLPESLEGVEKVWVKGGVFEPWAHAMALRASDPWGASSDRPAKLSGSSKIAASVLSRIGGDMQAWSAARVDVSGTTAGNRQTVTLGIVDHLPNLVAAPLVAGAEIIARGEVEGAGVVAPEQVFEPVEFFSRTGQRGVRLASLHSGETPVRI